MDQGVENDAVLIAGAPEPVWLAGDRDDDLASLPYTYATKRSVDATGWQILERKARFIDAAMSGDGIVRVNSILPASAPGWATAVLFLLTNCRRARPDSTPKIAYTYLP